MVSGNLKYDYKPNETNCILENDHCMRKSRSSCKTWFLILPLVLIFTASFVLSTYAFLKLQTCKEEIESLKIEVEKLKAGWIDNDLFDDIKQFENEDLYSDNPAEDRTPQPWLINGGDDLDADYDLNYDDDEDEDLTDTLRKFIQDGIMDGEPGDFSPDHEDITNLMKGGSFTKVGKETKRTKRETVASTMEGVPINAESYADAKRKNKTRTQQDGLRLYDQLGPVSEDRVSSPNLDSGYQSPAWLSKHHSTHGLTHYEQLEMKNPTPAPAPVVSRSSRVMHVDDKSKTSRRVVKNPQLKSGSQRETVKEKHPEGLTIVRDDQHHRRGHKQRANLETFDERTPRRMRALPAIHFNGDTSKYVLGQHTNFNGNGHLRHLDQTYIDWRVEDWVKTTGMDQHFQMHEGRLTIKESGLYLIYAQIYYLDQHDTNGYRVYKNQHTTLLQCTTMTHSVDPVLKGNTCYTAGIDYLVEGDQISVRDIADGRYSLFEAGKSFFGVVKLGDVKVK